MTKKTNLNIKTLKISDLAPADYNPRASLSSADIEYKQIKKSIQEFDYVAPLVFNERTKTLVAGHQRLKVLKDLGYTHVEVNCLDIDEIREKALNIALNKISGRWDNEKLSEILNELASADFNTEMIGFTADEIKSLNADFNLSSLTNSIENNAFNGQINRLKDFFSMTFTFPLECKEFMLSKFRLHGRDYYASKIREVFYA